MPITGCFIKPFVDRASKCTLGAAYGNLFGGHLFKATVFTTTELFLAKVRNSKVKKKQGTVTGLTEMRTDL